MDKLPGDSWLSSHKHRFNDLSIPKRLDGGSGGNSRIKVKQDSMGSRLERIKDLFLGLPQPSAFVKNRRQSGDAFVDLDASLICSPLTLWQHYNYWTRFLQMRMPSKRDSTFRITGSESLTILNRGSRQGTMASRWTMQLCRSHVS